MTWCRFPYGWIRHSRQYRNLETHHSRAGGNLDPLTRRESIGNDCRNPSRRHFGNPPAPVGAFGGFQTRKRIERVARG
ncbi:hypothetical protein E4O79_12220, partial [Neisseria meningitidis]|nr:hypothetical protein [Neisseria meningitidis]